MTEEVATEETPQEEVSFYDSFLDGLPFSYEESDAVTKAMVGQIAEGIDEVNKINVYLVPAAGQATPASIDSDLKEYVSKEGTEKDEEIVQAWKERLALKEQWDAVLKKTRNLYRVKILHQEEVETPDDMDEPAARNKRKVAMEAITLLRSFWGINQNQVGLSWLDTLEIPQVGRKATTVTGLPKPRALVSVDGKWKESFGEAAKEITTDANPVSAADLIQAWMESGQKTNTEFLYGDFTLKMVKKEKGDTVATHLAKQKGSTEEEVSEVVDLENIEEDDDDDEVSEE